MQCLRPQPSSTERAVPRANLYANWHCRQINRGLINVSPRPRIVVVRADKGDTGSFGDELLDFMYAGKKLRKWYGEEGMVLPRDGGGGPRDEQPGGEEQDPSLPRDQILVLDADSPMGEQVVLQLILARAKIKALVKDAAAASAGFGPYITAVQGSAMDPRVLAQVLRGVRGVVACGPLGGLLPAAAKAGVQHLVLLSSVGAPKRGLFGGLGEAGVLGDAAREQAALQAAKAAGLAVTVVRVGSLADRPGGSSGIALAASGGSGSGSAPSGEICREDAAAVLARAAEAEPAAGSLVILQAQNSSGLQPDWEAALEGLLLQGQAA